MSDLTPSSYRPLFRIDPGWPFVLAGLALLIAGVLIPAQRELHELRGQQRLVEANEVRLYARLEAYDRFLNDLRASDPDLVRRLAIAQLNMVPKGEQSLLLTPGLNQTVAQWIDESVPPVAITPEPYPDTLLGRLALGPKRLWLLAAAAFLLFVGLLIGPDPVRPLGERVRGGFRDFEEDGESEDQTDGRSAGDARGQAAGTGVARGAAVGAAVGGLPLSFGSAADADADGEADGEVGGTTACASSAPSPDEVGSTVASFERTERIADEGADASVIDVEIVDDTVEEEEATEEELDGDLEEDLDEDLEEDLGVEADSELDEAFDDESLEAVDEVNDADEEASDEDGLDDEGPSAR